MNTEIADITGIAPTRKVVTRDMAVDQQHLAAKKAMESELFDQFLMVTDAGFDYKIGSIITDFMQFQFAEFSPLHASLLRWDRYLVLRQREANAKLAAEKARIETANRARELSDAQRDANLGFDILEKMTLANPTPERLTKLESFRDSSDDVFNDINRLRSWTNSVWHTIERLERKVTKSPSEPEKGIDWDKQSAIKVAAPAKVISAPSQRGRAVANAGKTSAQLAARGKRK